MRDFKKNFMYTWNHKKMVLKAEKKLTGRITLGGILHDTDKLFLYLFFSKKQVSKIHRSYSRHHTGNHKTEKDVINALVDWESSRYSKPDKQETPREYLEKYIPEHIETYKPFMEKLGIWE